MPVQRVKERLPGFSPEHGLSSHRLVYRNVGEGLPHRGPLLRPCMAMSILVMALVAYVFKSF